VSAPACFRIGDVTLALECDDQALQDRFDEIYGDCAVPGPGAGPHLTCRVAAPDGAPEVTIEFDDPEPLDLPAFVASVFPDRRFAFSPDEGGRRLRAPADSAWRPFVANLAVNRALRLQPAVMFFHAASFAVRDQGILACGPKRSGKTTLALAVAARGHPLFGDELAAVRLASRELLPVRRSLAVREGPASAPATAALRNARADPEVFPDGERRLRAAVRSVFPGPTPHPAGLTMVLLLRTFSARATAERAPVTPALLGHLTPIAGSLWGRPRAQVAMQLLQMLSTSRVYWFDGGAPEESAELIERLTETA